MKTITKYAALDGREFTTEKECLAHEAFIEKVQALTSRLSPVPDTCDFSNGRGYVQQQETTFWSVREGLLRLAQEHLGGHKWISDSIDNPKAHPSWAERIIGEGAVAELRNAWRRISCTDTQFREWGQPYSRDHPWEGKSICLNP